jgi:hypothetical protein
MTGRRVALAACALLACRAPDPGGGSGVADPTTASVPDPKSDDAAASATSTDAATEDVGPPPHLLTFANGAIPIAVGGTGAKHGATLEEAVEAIDGSSTPYAMVRQAPADVVTEVVIELPAATTFTDFAVPRVHEVPSKFTTFTRDVEVLGSSTSATDGFAVLASATLSTHTRDDELTALPVKSPTPVRWIKLRLRGGISVQTDASNFEFSEIIGHGTQDTPPLLEKFGGSWRTRGAAFDLQQDGPLVSGCYDDVGELDGTVAGNILRARGKAKSTGVVSIFVLTVMPDGELRGLRSTNGAPFRVLTSARAPAGTKTACPRLGPPKLGCGSVIHGIGFAFDSAKIRSESEPVLARLFAGLDRSKKIRIEGHTSSEGKDAHNRDLSQRRAQAVVDDLVRRGLAKDRLVAVGRGPDVPIADNGDEAGRSMNRRVEIHCD